MQKIIAVDFDGTCVKHRYPKMGEAIPYAIEVIRELRENGHQIILWTMRSGEKLDEAIDWFSENGITLWGVNENPAQHKWTKSNKQFADCYIDDAGLGCPTYIDSEIKIRRMVDWVEVREILKEQGYIK